MGTATMTTCTLKLYIRGMTGRFRRVIMDVQQLCDEYLGPRCNLEIVDLQEQPHLAQQLNIFMVPTLIKEVPEPAQRFVGSFDNLERLKKFLSQLQ
jgi:circadian clock protein KaiB